MTDEKRKRNRFIAEQRDEIEEYKELDLKAAQLGVPPIPHLGMSPDATVRKLEERCGQVIQGFKAKQTQPGDTVKVRFAMLNWLWRDRAAKAAGFHDMEEMLKETLEENLLLRAENNNLKEGKSAGGIIIP